MQPFLLRSATAVAFLCAFASCSGSIVHPSSDERAPRVPEASGGSAGTAASAGDQGGTAGGSPSTAPSASGGNAAPRDGTTAIGVLDCPTVDPPGYGADADPTVASAKPLSAAFTQTCGTCHGSEGQGQGPYPALPGNRDERSFIAYVRQGSGAMPPFPASYIADEALARDFEALRELRSAGPGARSTVGREPAWSNDDVERLRRDGLAMFRKRDAHGAACASCHSPDGLDLALIGYPDATILRRALMHLSPDDALVVRDFVHAQRRHWGITRPCSPSWRVLQPGGEVLPGATVGEQEVAFFEQLAEQGSLIATAKIDSPPIALRAYEQLATLDLRRQKIGIALPRWTEDRFNGEEHRTINDWIPAIPRIPNDDAWYALVDAYLKDPTDDRIVEMDRVLTDLTNDGGWEQRYRGATTTNPPTFSGEGPFELTWLPRTMMFKHRAVLLGQHFMRMALLHKQGWLELPKLPFAQANRLYNPFVAHGLLQAESPCGPDATCSATLHQGFPVDIREDLGAPIEGPREQLGHVWSAMGQLFDQTLLQSEKIRGSTLTVHYWNEFTFTHKHVHRPFFAVMRVIAQAQVLAMNRTAPTFPRRLALSEELGETLPPVANAATWMMLEHFDELPSDPAAPETDAAIRLRANLARMVLYVNDSKHLVVDVTPIRALGSVIANRLGDASVSKLHPELLADRAYLSLTDMK